MLYNNSTYEISSVAKLTIVLIKLSFTSTCRIDFQSLAFSPSSRQMDSNAVFTAGGGLAMERTSTKCCFLIDFTAKEESTTRYNRKQYNNNNTRAHMESYYFTKENDQVMCIHFDILTLSKNFSVELYI